MMGVMARQSGTEREKSGKTINAEGEAGLSTPHGQGVA